jgi:hypothetical protein
MIIEVEEVVASISEIIKVVIVDRGTDTTISLHNISTSMLQKAMEYCTFRVLHDFDFHAQIFEKDKEKDEMRRRQEEEIQDWNRKTLEQTIPRKSIFGTWLAKSISILLQQHIIVVLWEFFYFMM